MRKHRVLAATLLLLGSGLAWAAPRISGTVLQVDSKSGLLVIKTSTGTKTIQVDSKAKVERNGSGSRLGAFHKGDAIQVVISGPLNDTPLHGVEVYDNETAAMLPPPEQPTGVYSMQHNTMQTSGGGVRGIGAAESMQGIGQGGATDANLQALQNQAVPDYAHPQGNPNYPGNAYNPNPQYDANGRPYQALPPGGPQGPTNQPAGVQAPSSGWSSQQAPAAPPVNNGSGWQANPPAQVNAGPGWSTGVQNNATTFEGLVRNVDLSRGMVFVSPAPGGQTVGVKVGMYTQVGTSQAKPHWGLSAGDIPPGSTVRVQGQMSGATFIANSVSVQVGK